MSPSSANLYLEEIRRALKAADLMKMLDGSKALGNKVGTKALGEHKVSSLKL